MWWAFAAGFGCGAVTLIVWASLAYRVEFEKDDDADNDEDSEAWRGR